MAADSGEISEDQLSTGLNSGDVHENPMEISTERKEGALDSTEIAVKPTSDDLTDQVSTGPQPQEEVNPLVEDLELMEVDQLPSSETTALPETEENGLNQTDIEQKTSDGTSSNSQDDLRSHEENTPLKKPPSSDLTCLEVSKNSTNVSMAEALSNVVYPTYVNSLQEAEEVLHRFENNTKTRFCVWRCPKDFGASSKCSVHQLFLEGVKMVEVRWDVEMVSFGTAMFTSTVLLLLLSRT